MLREGASYHVTARTNDKALFLDSDGVKDLFLDVVRRAKRKHRFSIMNFCVMGNHVHFIIQPSSGESLSSIMQWILGVFAMAYNRRSGHSDHVWGRRFFSRIISGFRDLLKAFDYIDDNPVSSGQVMIGGIGATVAWGMRGPDAGTSWARRRIGSVWPSPPGSRSCSLRPAEPKAATRP